jgi:hypothetical protein
MYTHDDKKLARAKKRIKDIKGFYSHLTVYLLINVFIFFVLTNSFTDFRDSTYAILNYLSTPVLWGVGLLIHGLIVFTPSFGFVKKWEERKMKELIEKDSSNSKF